MTDLIDFSELENEENICPDEDQENRAPKLVQSPVIVNPILKQSTKDNLIQLYTPVQKPVKGKLKVTFGSDTVLQTPNVKRAEKAPVKLKEAVTDKQHTEEQEKEDWRDRTSVLTSIDHQVYTGYAREFVEEIIKAIPVKEEDEIQETSIDSGADSGCAMDCSEYESEPLHFPVLTDENNSNLNTSSNTIDILAQAEALLKSLNNPTTVDKKESEEVYHVTKETVSAAESEEEFMDCEEYMEGAVEKTVGVAVTDAGLVDSEATANFNVLEITPAESPHPEDTAQLYETAEPSKVDHTDSIAVKTDTSKSNDEVHNTSQQPENDTSTPPLSEDKVIEKVNSDQKSEQEKPIENVENNKTSDNNQQLSMGENMSPTNQNAVNAPTFNDIDDQPILPKKGVYNFDEIDFDSIDPFKPKSQIVNSPDKTAGVKTADKVEPIKSDKDYQGKAETPEVETEAEISGINVGSVSDKGIKSTEEIKENDQKIVEANQKNQEDQKVSEGNATSQLAHNEDAKPGDFNQIKDAVNTESSVPPIDNKKTVSQDVDFLSIEDPFRPQNQMMNSPIIKRNEKITADFDQIEDPFKPRNQMQNSPIPAKRNEDSGSGIVQEISMSNENEVDDPFKPKSQIVNSPVQVGQTPCVKEVDDTVDPFKPKTQIQNSPQIQKHDNKDLDKGDVEAAIEIQTENTTENKTEILTVTDQETASSSSNSLDKTEPSLDEIENPFETKSQVANSPDVKSKVTEIVFEDIEDPFKPKKQMVNSPIRTETKDEPILEEMPDPSKPLNQMVNSSTGKAKPEVNFDEMQDPFKPKNQMANSPQVKTSAEENLEMIEDPFKPKNQMMNSPPMKIKQEVDLEEIDDPFKPKNQMAILPLANNVKPDINFEDIEDPFKPKQQMANSPAGNTSKPEINFEDIDDPFKPKKQMTNSPPGKNSKPEVNFDEIDDPFKPKKQMANSPQTKEAKSEINFENIEDPFKPKKQMANSPAKEEDKPELQLEEIEDPFKPKNQMMNSPISKEKESSKINFEEIVDPFKPKTQMQNSPAPKKSISRNLNEIKNPFSPNTQNTHKTEGSDRTMSTESALSRDGLDATVIERQFTPSSRRGMKASVSMIPEEIDEDGQEDIFEITGVTRRGDQPQDAKIANFDDLGIDENQFVSAAQVFNDPGMLDLLEQFGDPSTKQQESSLSRMSLYVKFDPLVEEAAPNPRRFSVRPDQIEKIREYGLDDCLLLLGTPPKKKRQSLSVSRRSSICPQFLMDRERVQSPLVTETGEVDKILACSPTKHKGDTPPTLKMPSLMGDMSDNNTGLFEELKYTETDMKNLRSSLQMEVQGLMLEKEREKFEMKKALETENERLKQQLAEKEKELGKLDELGNVCDMFEQTCMELKEKHQKALEENEKKIKSIQDEKNTALNDLESVEKAFTDLHKRYNKSKTILETMKKNEDALKKYATECHDNLKDKQKQIATMKKTLEETSKRQQQEIETKNKQLEECQNKLEAQAKVHHMKLESLEKQIQQKTAENKELTDICDKLLGRNG